MPEKIGLGCGWCKFRTPALDLDGYAAMSRNLQRHAEAVHGLKASGGEDEQRSTTRSRSRSGRFNVEELDHPCPDCKLHSFASEAGLYMHRKKSCGLRGVKSTSLDFACEGEGCDRAFTSPMGLATHRRSCKKRAKEVVAREEVSGQPKEKRRKVVPEEGDVSSRSPPTRQQWGKNEGGKSRSQTAGGDTSARKKASEEGATAQRSVTSHQGASTSQGRGQRTDASEIKMEVDVLMKLKNGGSAITKYRVGCLTPMQSVIKKVAAKMEEEVHKVRLYWRNSLVPGTAIAVNYGGYQLIAQVLGMA